MSSLVATTPKTFVNAEHTQAQVIAAKPATAFDFCHLSIYTGFLTPVTDQAACNADAKLVPHRSPHQVAGGARAENILKCQLKPLSFNDYSGIVFTAGQQARHGRVRLDLARSRPATAGLAADLCGRIGRRAAAAGAVSTPI